METLQKHGADAETRMPVLSIVIPAYNESAFIHTLLERIVAVPVERLGFKKEIVVVNDGSKDDTEAIARRFAESCTQVPVRVFTQVPNQGKGKAVQRGIRESGGDYILIQDADLEYDPNDSLALLEALKTADVVYGSRTLGQYRETTASKLLPGKHPGQGLGAWSAGVLLTLWTLLLYGRWITDTLTAYKLYPAAVMKSMKLRTTGFETDHEITAKLIRRGLRIRETPIAYLPRSREEGKKIKASDGFIAVWTLLRFRFSD
jgi:glycosyltransferase involved in cell wall biosynthesis